MTRGSRIILFAGLFTILILALAVHASADPLDNWHVRYPTTLIVPDDLRSVAFGKNTFVAVGESGAILTSQDTHRWVRRTSPVDGSDLALHSVVFANNTFIAVGDRGTILTSPNGYAWKKQKSGISARRDEYEMRTLRCVTFGNGKFIAVGSAGMILTSRDGVKWKKGTLSTPIDLYAITFGNGVFVAVGNDGVIFTSPDGSIWTQQASPDTIFLLCVIYGNGTFVAAGFAERVYTSPDGITWTPKATPLHGLWGATFANNIFVVVGSNGIMTSPDGDSWTVVSHDGWHGVTFANNTFVAVGGRRVATSSDAITWTMREPHFTITALSSVTYGRNRFVAVWGGSNDGATATSPDGITWTQGILTEHSLTGVAYGNDTFVVVGYRGTVHTSGDGITWVQIPPVTWENLYGITFGNNTFVAVGTFGNTLVSPDGITWTPGDSLPFPDYTYLSGVFYCNNIFVAVKPGYPILTSPDGITWTPSLSPNQGMITDVAYGNNIYVAVGGSRVLTSLDGITWSEKMSAEWSFDHVAYGDNTFVAVGDCGKIFTSPDGLVWTPREWEYYNFGCYPFYDVTYGNNTFLAVGNAGQWGPYIVQSDPVAGEYYSLTVASSGPGTITSLLPGINCGNDCSETFFQNTHVTLLATPDPNSAFTGWTGCDIVDGYFCTVAMNGAKDLTAGFITVDLTGPTVVIRKPSDGKTLTTATALVSGTATDSKKGNNGIVQVMVNGERAANDTAEGTQKAKWSATIPLEIGNNIINVVATDGAGNTTTTTRTVTRFSESLAISSGIAQNN